MGCGQFLSTILPKMPGQILKILTNLPTFNLQPPTLYLKTANLAFNFVWHRISIPLPTKLISLKSKTIELWLQRS